MKGTGISLSFHPRLDPPPSEEEVNYAFLHEGFIPTSSLNSCAGGQAQTISQEISDKPECLLTVDG